MKTQIDGNVSSAPQSRCPAASLEGALAAPCPQGRDLGAPHQVKLQTLFTWIAGKFTVDFSTGCTNVCAQQCSVGTGRETLC